MLKKEFRDTYRFKPVRLIAEGGMGHIYEAILYGVEGFEKRVAIKMVREDFFQTNDFIDLFIGEAKLVADLVHQNIVQIYKLGKVGRRYYIAMEYVHGITVRDLMRRHAELNSLIPIDLGAFIISRVCRGLEYAHAQRDTQGMPLHVVHRDINPNNLMISSEGEVKITDFGVAKARNLMRDREGSMIMGKAPFMSPEQAKGEVTDKRSDLFSLGVVMFELLTGTSLFNRGGGAREVMQQVISAPIPSPRSLNPAIPLELEKIMMKSVEKDLDRRYADAEEMGYDLEYFMYSKGYGPTIITLEKHLRKLFPDLYLNKPEKEKRSGRDAATSSR